MITVKRTFATLTASALLFVGAAGPASAQQQDGLVNVMVGDVTILQDVNIGVAAQVAANVCGVKVGPVAVLATQVDASGAQRTVCGTGDQAVRLTQNSSPSQADAISPPRYRDVERSTLWHEAR
jgi:hypothetical protein